MSRRDVEHPEHVSQTAPQQIEIQQGNPVTATTLLRSKQHFAVHKDGGFNKELKRDLPSASSMSCVSIAILYKSFTRN
jgi:hypothetical protein